MTVRLSTAQEYAALIDKYDTWMFDCDGVLWHDENLVEGAVRVLQILREKNKKILFVTNNATKSRKNYKGKFDRLGVKADVDEIFGSAYAAAVYISSVLKLPKTKKVYVIGMKGLEEELENEGISFLGGTDPTDCTLTPFSPSSYIPDPDVAAVVCGLDTAINYTKLSKAFLYLTHNPDCQFIATNEDSTYPTSNGLVLPGAGAIWAPLSYALGKSPVSVGKPAKTMLDAIRAKVNFDSDRTIMVGDRLNTDILFGQAGGLGTLLVLTGISTEEEVFGPKASPVRPDYVVSSIGDLCK